MEIYLDSTNCFIRKNPVLLYHRYNIKGDIKPVVSPHRIEFNTDNKQLQYLNLGLDLLPNDHGLFMKAIVNHLFYFDYTVVYTNLDLSQTINSVRRNKNFKLWNGKTQLIINENDNI